MLGHMKDIKEGNGTLLDHSMVAFGSPIRDGSSHNPHNIPDFPDYSRAGEPAIGNAGMRDG